MSERVYFRMPPQGFTMVKGDLVRLLQGRLANAGVLPPGEVDGVFGGKTRDALKAYQAAHGLAVSGAVDGATWTSLTQSPPPALDERCLQLTASFEGHGYGLAKGDFDGAGLTWGIIGFTLQHGEVQPLLRDIEAARPGALAACFGPQLAGELTAMLGQELAGQMAWAKSITLDAGGRLPAAWADGFMRLGELPEAQSAQRARAGKYFANAAKIVAAYKLASERGRALAFDIAVQNGSVKSEAADAIARQVKAAPPADEPGLLRIIADCVADASRPQWRESVRRRKLTLANGQGTVNAAQYDTASWGVADLPAAG